RLAGARAAPEGTHSITSPVDHRPNRVGNFTSTLLGKLRPRLTVVPSWKGAPADSAISAMHGVE
ncbi:hypothetical protein QZM38_27610, partial [Burkholderia orbicola]|uniref:hypothetical protein n=1 Tax=Burkholderia orbicola TaxID=2978683 RepID=UPI00264ED702